MKKLFSIIMLCGFAASISVAQISLAADGAAEPPKVEVQTPAPSLEPPTALPQVQSEIPTQKTETSVPATETAEVAKPGPKASVVPPASNAAERQEKKSVVKVDGSTVLPLRVLVRPFSSLYAEPSDTAKVVEENIPALQAYYVYQKPVQTETGGTEGWYEVGTDNRGTTVGWMKSKDVFEWKQTMVLSYTHPEGRHPVLMFDKKEQVQTFLNAANEGDGLKNLYASIENSKVDPKSGLISVEPKQFVDFKEKPYFLPILDFESITVGAENREARLLKIAAVTTGANARESSDIRTNNEYLKQANIKPEEIGAATLKNLKIDVVWVMDTTKSMRPYIQETLKVVQQVSKDITSQLKGQKEIGDMIRFGFWGYRDDESIKGIEYRTKNYTPALQSIADFEKTLTSVDVTQIDSVDYPEDMFSGVNDAIDKTGWSDGAMKIMVVVADAPSHEAGHKWNYSQMTDETLRKLASDRQITIGSLHLKSPDAAQYFATAESQLRKLSSNTGTQEGWYLSMKSEDVTLFGEKTKEITDAILKLAEQANPASTATTPTSATTTTTAGAEPGAAAQANGLPTSGIEVLEKITVPTKPAADVAAVSSQEQGSKKLVNEALKAALVQWIGSASGAEAPRDIVAWASDKDLMDTNIQSLEVRFLINKRQLDSLQTTMKTLVEAGRRGQLSGDDFFSSLQAAAATTVRDPEMIKKAKKLSQTGLIPEFLAGLPYKSQIMEMDNDLWMSWSVDEQDNFLAEVESRIKTYETIHNSPEGWIQLNKGDDPDEYVYPMSLALMP